MTFLSVILRRSRRIFPVVQKVRQEFLPWFRQYGFRMKLHTPYREVLVFEPHDFVLFGLCCYLKTPWQGISLDKERMIPRRLKWVLYTFKYRLAIMVNKRGLAVH